MVDNCPNLTNVSFLDCYSLTDYSENYIKKVENYKIGKYEADNRMSFVGIFSLKLKIFD